MEQNIDYIYNGYCKTHDFAAVKKIRSFFSKGVLGGLCFFFFKKGTRKYDIAAVGS